MTLTVVTNNHGSIIATMQGSTSKPASRSGVFATLEPAPGQIFREIDVPDAYMKLPPQELHDRVAEQLRAGSRSRSSSSRRRKRGR
jgi:hypothetical protein